MAVVTTARRFGAVSNVRQYTTQLYCDILAAEQLNFVTELRFYVQPNTKYVISETFFPAEADLLS